jgi:membrane associated rhomboid family serine protease
MEEQNEDNQAQPGAVEYPARFSALGGIVGWMQSAVHRWPLHASGVVRIEADHLVMRGWRRTWLGVPLEGEERIELAHIRNVAIHDRWVRFETAPPEGRSRRLQFRAASDEAAAAILDRLPKTVSAGFAAEWQELRAFDQALALNAQRALATPIFIGLNLLVFAACVIAGRGFWMLDPQLLGRWGNAGVLVMEGEWYRLVTAFFMHAGLMHLLVNMWVLWGAGRLTERLYGTGSFVVIYLASGILASLGSIAWNPFTVSVGASGAIFAVLGALLAFLARSETRVPKKFVRAHALSTAAFVLFNLVSGMLSANIDNAAHVTGLIAGCVLGWTLARRLSAESRVPLSPVQIAAAGAVACVALAAGVWQVYALRASQPAVGRYWAAHQWFMTGQDRAVRAAAEIQARVNAGAISEQELFQAWERDVVAFWRDAEKRLSAEAPAKDADVQKFAAMIVECVKFRSKAVQAVAEGAKNNDRNRINDSQFYGQRADEASARIARLELRAQSDRFRSLSRSRVIKSVRDSLASLGWECALPRDRMYPVTWDPAARDGALGRIAAGCDAQRAFETGDYASLDKMLHPPSGSVANLDDGDSRLAGVFAGLSDSFEQRQTPEAVLARLGDWRRQQPDSEGPDLVEAALFHTWAWSARGGGYAKEVSPNAWALYGQRMVMARAALADAKRGAESSPVWYQLALVIGNDASLGKEELRSTFDDAVLKYPDYYSLHKAMLRILMPRWHGSYEEVDDFIEDMLNISSVDRRSEVYARLYSMYADLEGDDTDLFKDAYARWSQMQEGYEQMLSRYPRSESIRNAYAAFACRAGDAEAYTAARTQIKTVVQSAWTKKYSPEACDQRLDKSKDPSLPAPARAAGSDKTPQRTQW